MSEWFNQSKFAKLVGYNRMNVGNQIRKGKVPEHLLKRENGKIYIHIDAAPLFDFIPSVTNLTPAPLPNLTVQAQDEIEEVKQEASVAPATSSRRPDYAQQKIIEVALKNKKLKLELDILTGKLVDAAAVKEACRIAWTAIRGKLLSLGGRFGAMCAEKDAHTIEQIHQREMKEVFRELENWTPHLLNLAEQGAAASKE